jgi:WD40 repeat protein/predicted Ser/Thr protein kinase
MIRAPALNAIPRGESVKFGRFSGMMATFCHQGPTMEKSAPSSSQFSTFDRAAALREEMKDRWQRGERTPVEAWLTKHPDLSEDDQLDLVYQEYVLRDEAGQTPSLDDYARRFPCLHAGLKRQVELYEMIKRESLADNTTVTAVGPPRDRNAGHFSKPTGGAIGHYHLLAELGRGGMGVVFKAHDTKLQRTVALKMLLNQDQLSAEQVKRFRVEAESLAQLQHPNIVQIFEVFERDGASFLAMEYVAGPTLQQMVQWSPLEPSEGARHVAQIARAVHSVHQRNIIHRDLKPSNVLVGADKTPKVTDFGLARMDNSELTTPGAIMGTPSYMAPEQAQGDLTRIGPATDVYALGAILFELLTGRAPFRGATVPATLHQVIHADPPAPRRLQPSVPFDLETIALKCLHKDPAKRYESARALAEDLERWQRGEPIRARPVSRLETLWKWARREPKVAALAAALVLLTVFSFAVVTYQWQAERHARQRADVQLYFNRIALADHELAAGKTAWALDVLEKCPPSLRDWEWRHLRYRCDEAIESRAAMPGDVSALAAHAHRDVLAVGCHNGLIVIRDADAEGKTWTAHVGSVNWLTFAGDALLSGGEDGRVCLWHAESGERTASFEEHEGPLSCVAVHPNKPWIASTTFSGPDSGAIFVWERETQKRVFTLRRHKSRITALAYDPKGRILASAGHDKAIILWDAETGEVVRELREHGLPIACLAFDHAGKTLASAAGVLESHRPDQDEIFVWDAVTGKVAHRLHGHGKRAVTLAFAANDTRLATAGWDNVVKVWDVNTGQDVLTLQGHSGGIMSLAFTANEYLHTGALDATVRTWKVEPRHVK